MAELGVDREVRGSSLLQVPGGRRGHGSPTRSRSRSKSNRSTRSSSPLPSLLKDDREKSPFEIGETKAMLKAAPKAVFDKALVMDISPSVAKKGDEEIIYITTDMSVIDKALVMDVSSVTLIVLEDEDEEDELESVMSDDVDPHEIDKIDDAEMEDGEEKKGKKVKKVVKKKKKKAVAKDKKEKTPPLKLDIKGPKKNLKGMFDKPTIVEEPPKEKKPMSAKKLEKLKMIEQMKAEAAAKKVAEEEEKRRKDEEKQRKLAESQAKRKPQEAQDGGLKAVLDKQRQKQEDAKRKAGIVDPLDARKTSTANGEIIDFKSGLRKVSTTDSQNSDSVNEENGDSNGEIELNLRPIKHSEMDFGDSDNEGSDNDRGSREGSANGDDGGEKSEPPSDLSGDEADNFDELRNFEKRQSRADINPTDEITAELEKTFFVARKPSKASWTKVKEEDEPVVVEPKKEPIKSATEKEKDAEWQRQREALRPPAIENFLSDRTVREFENLKLTCNVSGPDLNIKWFKNGIIVEKSNRVKLRVSDGLLVLEIPKAEIADSGEYSCLIRNKNGDVSTKCNVTVYKEVLDRPTAPTFTTIRGSNSLIISLLM